MPDLNTVFAVGYFGEYQLFWFFSSDDNFSMGGHECTLPLPKSPCVQNGGG
jgi:hypothetical protein